MKSFAVPLQALFLLVLCISLFRRAGADDNPSRKNLVENGGLEQELAETTMLPEGWVVTEKIPGQYEVKVVDGGKTGKKCLQIKGDGGSVQVQLKQFVMKPNQRTVSSGWFKGLGGDGVVSLMYRTRGPDKQRMGSMTMGGIKSDSAEWTQTSMIEHPEFLPPGCEMDFMISGSGKINALFDDLESFSVVATPEDLLNAMGDFESHYNRNFPPAIMRASSGGGAVSAVPDETNPASGRYCLRLKGQDEWSTATLWPAAYELSKVYTLSGKVRVNSGKACLRIDYYKDNMRKNLLGSTTSKLTESNDWQPLSVDTSDNKLEATHITATCVCQGGAEACFDDLVLLAK